MTEHICDYGCGNPGVYYFKIRKKWCCSKQYNQCPKVKEIRRKTIYTPEFGKKMSECANERWARPGFKEKMDKINSQPEVKGLRTRRTKEALANPEIRKKMSEIAKLNKTPELRQHVSNVMKTKWQDPDYVANHKAAMDEWYVSKGYEQLRRDYAVRFRGEANPNYGNGCKMEGPLNPKWIDGRSYEGYAQSFHFKEYRKELLERDGYKCQNPDCEGKAKKADLHHIDHNKGNCAPWNLITLCASCHGKTRRTENREFWHNYYRNIMQKRGISWRPTSNSP